MLTMLRTPTALPEMKVIDHCRIFHNAFTEFITPGAAVLTANIADTRQMLSGLNLNKTILVGNSDAGSYFNNKVLEAVDYGVSSDLRPKVEFI
jgi:hypothetical protein